MMTIKHQKPLKYHLDLLKYQRRKEKLKNNF